MTPTHQPGRSANSPRSSQFLIGLTLLVALATFAVFLAGRNAPSFADEYAYISQSYFADLFFTGQTNDPAWLSLPGYDLQPLPKYLIGLVIRGQHKPMPGPADAYAWYRDYHQFGDQATLQGARWHSIGLGVLGCMALFGCGVLLRSRVVGVLAALLLAASAIYRLLAHRAMSDVPCEAFLLGSVFLGLYAWRRAWRPGGLIAIVLAGLGAGVAAGLSLLCKFNGFLALGVLGVWAILALITPGLRWTRRALAAGFMGTAAIPALAVLVLLNPFLTAQPAHLAGEARLLAPMTLIERLRFQLKHRVSLSQQQKINFPHNALHDPLERLKVFVVQGFGRFGPLGPSESNSEIRYDWKQDRGALIWAPLAALGLLLALRDGLRERKRGQFPAGLALAAYALASWCVIGSYLPMAWDRYLLPIQAPAVLLGAYALGPLWDRWRLKLAARVDRTAPSTRAAVGVACLLFASYAYFWHTRDWNTSSRLMLVYSLVDRGTVDITGLEQQTGDRALDHGRYYSDKLPGYPFLAAPVYLASKLILGLPSHPLNHDPYWHWAADYWVTLFTSGIYTALAAAILVIWAGELGARPRWAMLLGLAYGLATPAYVYATLAYGHQATALALLLSMYLITHPRKTRRGSLFAAGLLASIACVVELQVAPAAAVLGCLLLGLVIAQKHKPNAISLFGVGAIGPLLLMLAYNQLAFGSPFDMGYFHHANPEFAGVHSREHPLGLTSPDWSKLGPLLIGPRRGLIWHAPILILAIPGWVALARKRRLAILFGTLGCSVAILLVNLSYPEWTGGWSTGPRLLTPLLPFAILPIAALLDGNGIPSRTFATLTLTLTLTGAAIMLLYQGADGRVPHDIANPIRDALIPLWTQNSPVPPWRTENRFAQNPVRLAFGPGLDPLHPAASGLIQFGPLAALQAIAIATLWRALASPPSTSSAGVANQQDHRDRDQHQADEHHQPERPAPDASPGFVPGGGVDHAHNDHQRQHKPVKLGDIDSHA